MSCYICGQSNSAVLQKHHIVPKRYGGGDSDSNLVTLCASCHQALERLYNKRFYTELGVEPKNESPDLQVTLEAMCMAAKDSIDTFEEEFEEFPGEGDYERYGIGEHAGWLIGYVDACKQWISFFEENYGVDVDREEHSFLD